MNFLRNLFSSTITFFLIPAIVIFIFISNVSLVVLNTSTFNSVLKSTNTYKSIADQVVSQVINQNISSDPETQKIVTEIAQKTLVIESQKLQTDLERVVTSAHKFVVSDEKSFETKVDLVPYQTTLKEKLAEVYTSEYANLPVCTAIQLKELKTAPTDNFPICQQKNLDVNALLSSSSFADTLAKLLPNTLIVNEKGVLTDPVINFNFDSTSLNQTSASQNTSKPVLLEAQNSIKSARAFQDYTLIAIIILVFLLILTRLPGFGSGLKWLGSALSSAAILPLVFATVILYVLKPDSIENIVLNNIHLDKTSQLQKSLISLVSANLTSFGEKILKGIQIESFILIVIAIALYGSHLFLEHRQKTKAQKPLDGSTLPTHNVTK